MNIFKLNSTIIALSTLCIGASLSGIVHSLNEFDSRWDLLIAEKSIIAVKFYLPHCQPCTAIAPIFQKLSEEFADKIFCIEINAHEHRSLARQLGFTRFPSFAYIKNGQKVAGHTGASESQIRSHCLSLIS